MNKADVMEKNRLLFTSAINFSLKAVIKINTTL